MDRKEQSGTIRGQPVRNKLRRQLCFIVKTTVDDGFQSLVDGEAHLRSLGVMIHRYMVGAHEHRSHRIGS